MAINWNMLNTNAPQQLAQMFDPNLIAQRNMAIEQQQQEKLMQEAQLMQQVEAMRQAPIIREQQAQDRQWQMDERQRLAQDRARQAEAEAAKRAAIDEALKTATPAQRQLLMLGVPAEKVLIQQPMEAPKTRTYKMGDSEVTEEWNPQAGQWKKIAEGGRWKPQTVVIDRGGQAQGPAQPQWKYDAASDEWVAPPTAENPQGLRTGSVSKMNAVAAAGDLINQFKVDPQTGQPKSGLLYKTPSGGMLGYKAYTGGIFDTADAREFDNLKEMLSTQMRTIFRIPGEGALSDKEQAQYGLQLPDRKNPPETNERILQRLQSTLQTRTSPTVVKPAQSAPTPAQGGVRFLGFE